MKKWIGIGLVLVGLGSIAQAADTVLLTDDFQDKCEEYYGDDLDWFFQQWVYEEGFPVFEYYTGCSNISPGNYRISLGITQIQEAELPTFITHMDAAVYSGGILAHNETVYIDERVESLEFDYSGAEPDSIVLDPALSYSAFLSRLRSHGILSHGLLGSVDNVLYAFRVSSPRFCV